MLTFCAQNWTFKNRKSARFSSVLREFKGFNKVYMPLATRNFKNIILLILKDKVASTPCGFFRCTELFSHKKLKVWPPPKARGFLNLSIWFAQTFFLLPTLLHFSIPNMIFMHSRVSWSSLDGIHAVKTFFSAQKQGFTSPKSARFSSVFSLIFLHHTNVWCRA